MAGFSFEEIPQRHAIAEHHEKVIKEEEVKITVEKVHPVGETPYCDQTEAMKMPVISQPYNGVEVDSKSDDILNIISFMEGSPWTVEYYAQYLGKDDESYAWTLDRPAAFQQYRCIKNFELRVTSSLSYSYDESKKEDELTGTAHIYPVMKPNKGDMFIADIGDGRAGLLEITSVKKLSARRNTAWEVDYFVRQFITKEAHDNLKLKTIDTVIFSLERLRMGNGAFIEEEVYGDLARIEETMDRLISQYFRHFYDDETCSFTVPFHNAYRTCDIKHNDFLLSLIDTSRYPEYHKVRRIRTDITDKHKGWSIWDALMNQDWLDLDDAMTKFNIIPRLSMRNAEMVWNGSHSQYNYFVYPYKDLTQITPVSFTPRFTAPAELPLFIDEDITHNRRYIYHVGMNQDYVFSQYFYLADEEKMSRLELQVFKYLKRQPLCPAEILRLMDASVRWDDLDRYYYIPILYLLAHVIVMGYVETYGNIVA